MTNRPGCVSAHRPRKGTFQRAVRGPGRKPSQQRIVAVVRDRKRLFRKRFSRKHPTNDVAQREPPLRSGLQIT